MVAFSDLVPGGGIGAGERELNPVELHPADSEVRWGRAVQKIDENRLALRLMLTRMRENRSQKRLANIALNQLCRRLCHAVRAQMCQISTLGDQTRVLPCGLILKASA